MSANPYLPGTIAIPSSLLITDITRTYPMVVSVTADPITASNTYHVKQLVKLNVPGPYRMFQADGLVASILDNTGAELILDVDARDFDAFVVPTGDVEQPASVAPSGSRNLEYDNTTRQVPFQSLNNIGN